MGPGEAPLVLVPAGLAAWELCGPGHLSPRIEGLGRGLPVGKGREGGGLQSPSWLTWGQTSLLRASPRVPSALMSSCPSTASDEMGAELAGLGWLLCSLVMSPPTYFTGFLESPLFDPGHVDAGRCCFRCGAWTFLALRPNLPRVCHSEGGPDLLAWLRGLLEVLCPSQHEFQNSRV